MLTTQRIARSAWGTSGTDASHAHRSPLRPWRPGQVCALSVTCRPPSPVGHHLTRSCRSTNPGCWEQAQAGASGLGRQKGASSALFPSEPPPWSRLALLSGLSSAFWRRHLTSHLIQPSSLHLGHYLLGEAASPFGDSQPWVWSVPPGPGPS